MTATATTDTDTKVRTRRGVKPPRRRRWVVWSILGVLVVILAIAGYWAYWLSTGLLDASRVVQDKAAIAQGELQLFRDTLKAGDEKAATAHLDAADAALKDAFEAAQVKQVRQAKGLPYVGNTVEDLDHLLAAADIMTGTGRDALAVYQNFSGEDSDLFSNGEFSIPAIHAAQESVTAISKDIDDARAELRQVEGNGPKGEEALAKKRSALEQIASLRAEIGPLEPVLNALPAAVGADDKKSYLVAIMNPAEMRASGGAPLSVAFIKFKDGKMSIPLKGTTSDITRPGLATFQGENPPVVWDRVKKDPFQPALGERQRFVNATFNPHFPVSAEQMLRATPTFFGVKTDGVIALDVVAVSHLLKVTGPIESPGYGSIDAENIVKTLLVDAYKNPDVVGRHDLNAELMPLMLSKITEGGGLIGKVKALGEAVPSRHLQLYFRDDRLQQLVVEKHLGGLVPDPKVGNLTAVYTQNGNGSKMDVFQKRTVQQTIKLRRDGSALISRTIALKNASPPYLGFGADRRRGYDTRWATSLVVNLMPDKARLVSEPEVALSSTVGSGRDQNGRTFAKAAVAIPPDSKAELTWRYVLPKAATKHGDAWRLLDYVSPQAMLRVPTYDLTVVAPRGWKAEPAKGWKVDGGRATTSVPMDRSHVLKMQVSPR
ncbi:MAG: DUF4012 domain-containing protein [Actinomycetes bacterium]